VSQIGQTEAERNQTEEVMSSNFYCVLLSVMEFMCSI